MYNTVKNRRVMVTGGKSMIGRAIVSSLVEHGASVDSVPHSECDLLNCEQVFDRISNYQPDYVIHAAGWNGGIEWNKTYPATIYYRTAMMALNVYYVCTRISSVRKIVGLLASCSYPDLPLETYYEDGLWVGRPNSTVECHGLAKRIIADFGRQVSKQYTNVGCISCIINNSYGPHDSFNPKKTKVVGALIRRLVEAKQDNLPSVTCWGTGSPLREFIYCQDAGRLITKCLMHYDDLEYPINITSNEEVSIRDLTLLIANLVGYDGEILWDTTKPDGQMRKSISGKRLQDLFPDFKFTPLVEGLAETIQWYKKNKEYADYKQFN